MAQGAVMVDERSDQGGRCSRQLGRARAGVQRCLVPSVGGNLTAVAMQCSRVFLDLYSCVYGCAGRASVRYTTRGHGTWVVVVVVVVVVVAGFNLVRPLVAGFSGLTERPCHTNKGWRY